jgi:hypothetical protein
MTIVVFLSKPVSYYGTNTAVEKYSDAIGYEIQVQGIGALELTVVQPMSRRTIVYAPGAWCKFELGGV